MPLVFTDLLTSKKFVFTVALTAAILACSYWGALTKPEVLALLGVLWPVYLGAQGVADVGQKIADGHVTVKEMAGQQQASKDAQTATMMETMTPLILKVFESMSPHARVQQTISSTALRLRALTKGDRVVKLEDPTTEGVVLDTYVPELSQEDPPYKVRCRFGGAEVEVERGLLAYVPDGTVLPKKTS